MDKKLQCKICQFEGMSLITHIKFKHNLSTHEYKEKYGDCILYIHSQELRKKISDSLKKLNENNAFRKLNSERQLNGGSCLTKKYWTLRGFSEKIAISKIKELQTNNSKKSVMAGKYDERSILCKKYWIIRGKSEMEAIELIRIHQVKASAKSSKFKGHIRSEESKEKIAISLEKRIKLFGYGHTNGVSKMERDFYNCIRDNVDSTIQANVRVGQYIVDVLKDKKIVEFYGDYWHCNPEFYKSTDFVKFKKSKSWTADYIWKKNEIRSNNLKQLGYNVLIIWESEWKRNKFECIDNIRKYLL